MRSNIHTASVSIPSSNDDVRTYIAVRAFVLLLLVGSPLLASCQLPAAPTPATTPYSHAWQRVESMPLGTSIQLNTRSGNMKCALTAIDDRSLTCMRGKDTVFSRADIGRIAIPHRGRSALIMGGIGAGVGVAVVKLVATVGFNGFFNGKAKGAVYAGGAGLGILVFAPIGYATDVTHSTIYKAP